MVGSGQADRCDREAARQAALSLVIRRYQELRQLRRYAEAHGLTEEEHLTLALQIEARTHQEIAQLLPEAERLFARPATG